MWIWMTRAFPVTACAARVGDELNPPRTATTWSTRCPRMPPVAFTWAKAIRAPCSITFPNCASSPVSGVSSPTVTGAACPWTAAGRPQDSTATPTTTRLATPLSHLCPAIVPLPPCASGVPRNGTRGRCLLDIPSPVHDEVVARDLAALLGGQEDHGVGHVLVPREPPQGHLAHVLLVHLPLRGPADPGLGGDDGAHAVALHDAGADRVDVDVIGAQLQGEGAGETADGPLGGGVGRTVPVPAEPGGPGDVDDLAVPLPDHGGHHGPAAEVHAPEVH